MKNPILKLLELQVANKAALEINKSECLSWSIAHSFGKIHSHAEKTLLELHTERDKLIAEGQMLEAVLNECRARNSDKLAKEYLKNLK